MGARRRERPAGIRQMLARMHGIGAGERLLHLHELPGKAGAHLARLLDGSAHISERALLHRHLLRKEPRALLRAIKILGIQNASIEGHVAQRAQDTRDRRRLHHHKAVIIGTRRGVDRDYAHELASRQKQVHNPAAKGHVAQQVPEIACREHK